LNYIYVDINRLFRAQITEAESSIGGKLSRGKLQNNDRVLHYSQS